MGPALIPRSARPPIWREARFGLEAAALLRDPIFRGVGLNDGRGRPVLLIPGFLAGDASLGVMANWLRRTGHRPSKAGMLANVDCSGAAAGRLEKRLEKLVREGPLVDGVTGQRTATVDGLSFEEYAKPLVQIREFLDVWEIREAGEGAED